MWLLETKKISCYINNKPIYVYGFTFFFTKEDAEKNAKIKRFAHKFKEDKIRLLSSHIGGIIKEFNIQQFAGGCGNGMFYGPFIEFNAVTNKYDESYGKFVSFYQQIHGQENCIMFLKWAQKEFNIDKDGNSIKGKVNSKMYENMGES